MEKPVNLFNTMVYRMANAFGTLFFDCSFIYLSDRNTPRVAVINIDDIIRDGQINLVQVYIKPNSEKSKAIESIVFPVDIR